MTIKRINIDGILGNVAMGRSQENVMLDPAIGGQFGYTNDLSQWLSDQAYVRGHLIPFVLRMPSFMSKLPDTEKYHGITKELFERRARVIEGLNAGLTVETDAHAFGSAGEMFDEPVNVTRARSEPVFTWQEIYGNSIQRYLATWIRYGIMDPDTKTSLLATIDGSTPNDRLADWYTMDMAFVEADHTHTKAVKAWVVTNMFPKETGEIIGKRDTTSAQELLTLTIPFTGIAVSTLGSTRLAQALLDSINIKGADPYFAANHTDGPDEFTAAVDGYASGVNKLVDTAITNMTEVSRR